MTPSFLAPLTLLLLLFSSPITATATLISSLGQTAAVPSWKVQSSAKTDNDAAKLSTPEFDTSTWYTVGSKATLMATLLENHVYNETDLFFSNNLAKVDHAPFQVPWFYRSELELNSSKSSAHCQLKTHGITSRADIYLNGKLIADKNTQAGAYGGLTYDITNAVKNGKNVLLIRAYPTNYDHDFALGFVDWNPYPPDNGTGVWRDVDVKTTGPVSLLSNPRVNAKLDGSVRIRVDLKSWVDEGVDGEVVCTVLNPQEKEAVTAKPRAAFKIKRRAQKTISLKFKIPNPQIWWPKQWGAQPLYSASCSVSTSSGLSDSTPTTRFGIRTVTSSLTVQNDRIFSINKKPFQVLGAGYTSDIFLRFSESKLRAQFQLVLDMGLNTVRLEGKQEHPYLYSLADEMGIMIMAGWECCDKWEAWSYNDDSTGIKFTDADYAIANTSMRHEAEMMQHHPSLLAFLVGSDYWPDDRAIKIYLDAMQAFNWDVPIIASASQRGYPSSLENSGMKMEGPYDWVPPNYWYYHQNGSAFGFGSELGAGVGTPELGSLKRFLSASDLDDLWKEPNKGVYHMSQNTSTFYDRKIYNTALFARYGAPMSLEDYLLKVQMSDYEATRAEFEAYAARWTGVDRPATGVIYWMLNNAWPLLHWNLFDYYLQTAGAFFGTKTASRIETAVYDYASKNIYLINRSLGSSNSSASRSRTIDAELIDTAGNVLTHFSLNASTTPNSSKNLSRVLGIDDVKDTALLRLVLKAPGGEVLSRNVYWLSSILDELDWEATEWWYTPVSKYADYTALNTMAKAELQVSVTKKKKGDVVVLENKSTVPAVFIRLNLVHEKGNDIETPVFWDDNYVTLWPGEKMDVGVQGAGIGGAGIMVEVSGKNVDGQMVDFVI